MELFKKFFWLLCLILGIIGFGIAWFFLPHQSPIDKIWWLVMKLVTYILIILSIAFFPNKSKWGYLLVIVPNLVFLGYILPRLSYFGFSGTIATINGGEFYTTLYLLLYPLINFTTAFAYRMAGGSPGKVIKISLAGVIIIFSGYLDLMWYVINPGSIPETLKYSSHIIIFFGHAPKYWQGVVFALCHIPLLVAVLAVPLDKWLAVLSRKFPASPSKQPAQITE